MRTASLPLHPFTQALQSALSALGARFRARIPAAPPCQLDLGLDRVTDSGLPLREAMLVRSAEFWLALGEPRLALKELDTLTELGRQNAWPQRVQVHAIHKAHSRTA